MDTDQARHSVWPDLDPNVCHSDKNLERNFEKVIFLKKSAECKNDSPCKELFLLVSFVDNLCKQLRPRSGLTKCQVMV